MNDTPDPYAMPPKLGELTFGPSQAIAIRTIEDAWRLATLIVRAKMAPSGMDTVEQITVALLHGAEIGLPPMMSVQKIAVIGGRPTVWGDAALAVIRNSGLLDFIDETIEGEGDGRFASCTVTRKHEEPKTSTFSVLDAKRAGLWDDRDTVRRKMKYDGWFGGKQVKAGEWAELPNDAPWKRFSDRMLSMRARGYRLRDSFGDVLGGLYLREEFIGGQTIDHDTAEIAPPRRAMEPPTPPEPPNVHGTDQDRTPEKIQSDILDKNGMENGPPEPPPPPSKMSAHEADIFILRYKERLEDVKSDSALDILWNDMVLPVIDADRLDDQTLAILQQMDDERRGLIQTHGGESDR